MTTPDLSTLAYECRRREAALEALRERLMRVHPDQRTEAERSEREAIRASFPRLDEHLRAAAVDAAGIPDENRPSRFNPDRMKRPWNLAAALKAWERNEASAWLYIAGPSGTGKSWAAARILERVATDEGFSAWQVGDEDFAVEPELVWFTGSDLRDNLVGKESRAETIRRCTAAACLVIDDLFHANSAAFLEALRRIIAERPEHSPTVITSNYRALDALKLARGKDFSRTMEAVVRRLAERCVQVNATLEPPPPESDQSADF